jgi:hypothetical protein
MSEQQSKHRTHRDALLSIFEAMNTGDFEAWGDLLTEDTVVEYPQSGERFVGIENNKAVLRNYPGHLAVDAAKTSVYVGGDEGHYLLTPMFTTVKVEGEGDTVVASVKSRYPDGTDWWVIDIAHFQGDKMDHRVMYFAPCFEAPDWREPFREPMPERA